MSSYLGTILLYKTYIAFWRKAISSTDLEYFPAWMWDILFESKKWFIMIGGVVFVSMKSRDQKYWSKRIKKNLKAKSLVTGYKNYTSNCTQPEYIFPDSSIINHYAFCKNLFWIKVKIFSIVQMLQIQIYVSSIIFICMVKWLWFSLESQIKCLKSVISVLLRLFCYIA